MRFFSNIFSFLVGAIRIQSFITLVALPILVFWGLSVSSLSIIGNIVFAPLLTAFLFISSIIFFCELLYIPNQWAIYLLEKLTSFWLKFSFPALKNWLLFFPQSTCILFALALALATWIIIHLHISKAKQALLLFLILFSSGIIAKLPFWIATEELSLEYRGRKMNIYHYDGKLTIHDYGTLNYYCGTESWIQYQLMPTLIRHFGCLNVKNLHIHKATKSTASNLEFIQQQLFIANTKIHEPFKPINTTT